MLFSPVVFNSKVDLPNAVLYEAVVFAFKAKNPKAALLLPVSLLPNVLLPAAVF